MIAVCQTTCRSFLYSDGRVAQLGERIHGMDEAAGSIPVTSTNFANHFANQLRMRESVPIESGRPQVRSLSRPPKFQISSKVG